MNLGTKSIIAALALSGSTVALAQAAPTVAPQTPAKSKTTTTQSTTTAQPVVDATGATAVQKTTDTTQTTTTQPATAADPATASTTSTTTVGTDATGAPAATTTTTTTEPATDAKGAAVTAATEADFKAGVPVFDQKGGVVGKIEKVSAKGAVVSTGKARAEIPTASFGKNDKGLVMSMTKAELEAAAAPKKK
jgi:hypothetical protein